MSLELIRCKQSSRPFVGKIIKILNTFDSTQFAVYFKVPYLNEVYHSIKTMKEIMLPHKQITFKVIRFDKPTSEVLKQQSNEFILTGQIQMQSIEIGNQFKCSANNKYGEISLTGSVINSNQGNCKIFDLSVTQIAQYPQFHAFRKKYKTLQNITRKIQFKLDHRLKIVVLGKDSEKNIYFALQQKNTDDHRHYFISSSQTIKIVLEELYSIEQWYEVKQIHEQTVVLNKLAQDETPTSYQFKFIYQNLQIILYSDLIQNQNLSSAEVMCIRVLQMSHFSQKIVIGTDKIHKSSTIKPLIKNYYDYEYAYLSQNLQQIAEKNKQQSSNLIYQNLNKLTKCFPKYPHFINQSILDIQNCTNLLLKTSSQTTYKIPFVYVLQGYNVFYSTEGWVRLYIEFPSIQVKQQIQQSSKSAKRKVYQFMITDLWNLSQLDPKSTSIQLKIITGNNTLYCINFSEQLVDGNMFKKQCHELQIRSQYSEKMNEKFYTLSRSTQKQKFRLIKTEQIKRFYLLDLYSSCSVYFKVEVDGEVKLIGSLSRNSIIQSKGLIRVILSSPDSSHQMVIIGSLNEIQCRNDSLRSIYNFKYQLVLRDSNLTQTQLFYDLSIKQLSEKSKKAMRKKIKPENKQDHHLNMRQFQSQGFYTKNQSLQVIISLRKMFYDEQLNYFDNQAVIEKRLIINPEASHLLQKNCLFSKLEKQSYNTIELDCYDNTIKQRLKLYIEIQLKNTYLLDQENCQYSIKIPPLLWSFNISKQIQQNQIIQIDCIMSRRKKKTQRISIPFGSSQQYKFSAYNYKDALSIKIANNIGFSRVVDCGKIKCQILKDNIGWIPQSQWLFSMINVGEKMFYFLLKSQFDPSYKGADQNSNSQKTVSKGRSQKSNSKNINPLAKTMKNMDTFKLKTIKNNLIIEGRHLTTKIVQRQQKIANLSKKIIECQQKLKKKTQEQSIVRQNTGSKIKNTKQYNKFKTIYNQICECGAKNPKFNGYCQNCLLKLRKRYQLIMLDYKQKCYEYEKMYFTKFNKKQKIIRAKNKLKEYYNKLKIGQDIQDNAHLNVLKDLQESESKRMIEDLKLDIYIFQEQRKSLTQSVNHRMTLLQKKIEKQDQEIWRGSQQLQSYKTKLSLLQEKIANESQK